MTPKAVPYLEFLYQEPHRHYHNLRHIHQCHETLDKYFRSTRAQSDLDLVSSVIWFHDAVYDTSRTDNEEWSAVLAKTWIESELWPNYEGGPQRVADLILLTKTHIPNEDPLAPVVLDVDLSILAGDDDSYWAYELGIRKEYSWVPAGVYAKNRIRILTAFRKREQLFLTPEMKGCDGKARHNLGRSIEYLYSLL